METIFAIGAVAAFVLWKVLWNQGDDEARDQIRTIIGMLCMFAAVMIIILSRKGVI
jgi:hypothetical protein